MKSNISEQNVAEITGNLWKAQLALHEIYINEMLDGKLTEREHELVIKKLKSIRTGINILIGD